jgi:hypothetical protein
VIEGICFLFYCRKYLAHFHVLTTFFLLQILFKYPPGKRLAMRSKDLAAFCFPGGVKV